MNLSRRLRRIPSTTPTVQRRRRHPYHSDTGANEAERRLLAITRQIKRLRQSMNGDLEGDAMVRLELRVLRDMKDALEAQALVQKAKDGER